MSEEGNHHDPRRHQGHLNHCLEDLEREPKVMDEHEDCSITPRLHWSDARHPLWSLARIGMLVLIISPVLYANCSKFDETEIRSIVITIGIFGSADYGLAILKNFTVKDK